jgi:hypothetical protein
MNLFLFGPPGIGKSTVIRSLCDSKEIWPIDLEEYWNDQDTVRRIITAIETLSKTGGCGTKRHAFVVGGAGLDPTHSYPGAKVLLDLPTQSEYERRRLIRDRARPEFAKQAAHELNHWRKLTDWYAVLLTNRDLSGALVQLSRK